MNSLFCIFEIIISAEHGSDIHVGKGVVHNLSDRFGDVYTNGSVIGILADIVGRKTIVI